MLPPPTTIAISTPRRWTRATSAAIASTRAGSVPYSRSPISASPESFSSTRANIGGADGGACECAISATDGEAGEAADDDVLARLGDQRRAQLLDRLAAVLVLVDVGLAQQHHLVQPAVELALDGPGASLLGDVGQLLSGDPLLTLALGDRDVLLGDGDRRRGGDVQGQVAGELDEPLVAGDEVGLAVDLDQHADLVAGVDVALHDPLAGLGPGALGRLRLSPGAQDVDRALEVARRLAGRLAAGENRRSRALAQRLDVLGSYLGLAHAVSSLVAGSVWGAAASAGALAGWRCGSAAEALAGWRCGSAAGGTSARGEAASASRRVRSSASRRAASSASRRVRSSASRRAASSASRRARSSASRRSRSSRARSSSATNTACCSATTSPIAWVIAAHERIASSLPGIT